MGLIRFLVWTSLCVGFGIFLGTYDLGGRTPWKLMQTAWRTQSPAVVEGVNGVKKKLTTDEKDKDKASPVATTTSGPRESHSVEDKKAIDQLISKRAN